MSELPHYGEEMKSFLPGPQLVSGSRDANPGAPDTRVSVSDRASFLATESDVNDHRHVPRDEP